MNWKHRVYFSLLFLFVFLCSFKIVNNEYEIRNLNKEIAKQKEQVLIIRNELEEYKLSCSSLENYNTMKEILKDKVKK